MDALYSTAATAVAQYGIWGQAAIAVVSISLMWMIFGNSKPRQASEQVEDDTPQPRWGLFCASNLVAVVVFLCSSSYLLGSFAESEGFLPRVLGSRTGSLLPPSLPAWLAVFQFEDPRGFRIAAAAAIGSLLYFFAFFGVAFVYKDVDELEEARASAAAAVTAAGSTTTTPNTGRKTASASTAECDADVVICGMGIAGASLAAVLARQGKRVVVIESARNLDDTIKGELLQPGGVRALERMGLASAAKDAAIDCIRVDGYVCMTPNAAGTGSDVPSTVPVNKVPTSAAVDECVVLSYPAEDPATSQEYLGIISPSSTSSSSSSTSSSSSSSSSSASSFNTLNGLNMVASGLTQVCPVTGRDIAPRGRAFHHIRFVSALRELALQEPNVTVIWGSARRLLTANECQEGVVLETIATSSASASTVDTSDVGYVQKPLPPGTRFSFASDPERIVGIVCRTEAGERSVTARLTIAANGMFSGFRKDLHESVPKKVSHFCGLVLKHPANKPPLPYPNRGHVILVDPNPVLFYQISSTDTRVLVDIPPDVFEQEGNPEKYFRTTVAPQLPVYLRIPFLEAIDSQRIVSMPCMALSGAPPRKKGAVMVGDVLNMRHPLTGGGMTVALKDVELLSNCLSSFDLETPLVTSERKLQGAVNTFYSQRGKHASTINILANALHRVFTKPLQDDGTRARLRTACIEYLSMGGPYSAGPVGLLSGLTPAPWVLVSHFFAVALYALRKSFLPPSFTRLRQGYDLMHVACMIIMPLLAAEKTTFLAWTPVQFLVNLIFPWRGASLN